MENSGKILFGDDAPQWYVAAGNQWIGPLSSSDVYAMIQKRQISLAHYVWKKGQPDWKRICDIKAFQTMSPHQPAKAVQQEVKQEVKQTTATKTTTRPATRSHSTAAAFPPSPQEKTPQARIWYLYYQESQYGPFSQEEMEQALKAGKINKRVYAWREGMANWDRLENIAAFKQGSEAKFPSMREMPSNLAPDTESSRDQRSTPRRPLVAKILFSDEQVVLVGVCRDISIGGLQLLTDKIPGEVGTKIKMNISPSSNSTGNRIEPFVAEGVIVRILEDGRGFSFRFERLSDQSRKAIETYINSPA